MKPIAVLSGDKRQDYINQYLNENGYPAYLKSTMDFNKDKYIVCSTPLCKKGKYLNCDFYSSFPIETFTKLLKPNQIIFGGSIPKELPDADNIKFIDVLADETVVWNNSVLTAEGLVSYIINNTDFTINKSKILILGFGKCGINIARTLSALSGKISIYDHTAIHLTQARAYGYEGIDYEDLINHMNKFDIIINTVPMEIFKEAHYSKMKNDCSLFEIASSPYGFHKDLAKKYRLSLITCPGIPGATAPKSAGELIAKSIISYLERTEINGSQL